MKKFFVLLSVLLLSFGARAQEETYLYAERDTCSLYLDIFRPVEGADTTFMGKPKPTIVFVFGGGFVMGERSDEFSRQWFQTLNENGYTLVTIDYRLGMKGYKMGKGLRGAYKSAQQFYLAQQMGVEDLFSAIGFLKENEAELRIDVGNLVLSGSSAGAIISLAAEYDIVCGRAQGLPEGFNFRGVMSFAGAIISISGAPQYPQAPCPTLLLHGTADKAVAYSKYGALGRGLWGSDYLASHWAKKGYTDFSIYRFKERTHDVAGYMNYVWPLEKEFLEQNVILETACSVDAVIDDPTLPTWVNNLTLDSIYRQQ